MSLKDPSITAADAECLARIALAGIAREYPNHLVHLLESDRDAAPPRVLHPAFFGCFDWHSAVHTHWMLLRLATAAPGIESRAQVLAALERSFEPARLSAEADYLAAPARHAFERPYGLAWLLRLDAELAGAALQRAPAWRAALSPLVRAARDNLLRWLPRLRYPVRSGTHNQSAFAFTLLLDSARITADVELREAVRARTLELFADDRDGPIGFEPSGEDFLSPCLMEAHLLTRLLDAQGFARWLDAFLPGIPKDPAARWLACAEVADDSDGKLVHLHGLNLARAWNLGCIAASLPEGDARVATLNAAAALHRHAGLRAALAAEHYAASHWLPTFALLALTEP